jgi:hypothetical protein
MALNQALGSLSLQHQSHAQHSNPRVLQELENFTPQSSNKGGQSLT